jgi:hypothetical protein
MKDMLVVGTLKAGQFQKFMGFMKSDEGMAERRKIADLSKTIGTVAPDHSKVMFKIAVHDVAALHAFWMAPTQCPSLSFDEVMEGYEIYDLQQA